MECGKRVNWTEWRKSVKGEVLLSLNVPSSLGADVLCSGVFAWLHFTVKLSVR